MSVITEKKPLIIQIPGERTPNELPLSASAVGYDFVQGNYIYYSTGSDSWITAPPNGGGGGGDNYFWSPSSPFIEASGSLYITGSLKALNLSASNGAEITGSLLLSGDFQVGSNLPVLGSDVTFFVSGAIGAGDKSVFGGDVVVSGSVASILGFSGSLTKLTDGTSYIIAGSGITVASASNGAITISATGGGGLTTGKQFIAAATTTTSTTALMIGQFSWVPADYTGLTSVRVRAIMATDGTTNHTGSLQIYNLTSGSYLDLVNTPSTGKHFTITGSTPTLVSSSNLLTGITNFNNSSTSVYEVRVSGSTANNTIIGGVELIFN